MMPTVAVAVPAFIVARQADGKRPATLRWYEQRLAGLVREFGATEIQEVDNDMMRAYVNALRSRQVRFKGASQRREIKGGLSDQTIHGHIRALRAFFTWCKDEYGLTGNPMKRISLPRLNLDRPKAAKMDDLSRLLACTNDDFEGKRARAMLLILADTGCRLSALLTMKISDLEIENHRAILYEPKVARHRFAWFSELTVQVLDEYLAIRRANTEYVFIGRDGNRLTSSGVHSAIKRLKKKAGVTGRVNPHAWRHAFAIEYLTNGGDFRSLAMLLGHSDVTVTMKFYALWGDAQLEDKHRQFSPIGKFK
jgi:integrase/recombinase XerD